MRSRSQYLNSISLLGIILATSALIIGLTSFTQAHRGFDLVVFARHLRQSDFVAFRGIPIRLWIVAGMLLIVGVMRQHWARRQMVKERLIQDAGSTITGIAIEAIDDLRRCRKLVPENGVLSGANLVASSLRGAQLWLANLQGADFSSANLQGANLFFANLRRANLSYSDLRGAGFSCADMEEAILILANLQGAILMHTNLEGATLTDAICDSHTVLPDGSKWSSGTDLTRFTDPNHPDYWRPKFGSVWWYSDRSNDNNTRAARVRLYFHRVIFGTIQRVLSRLLSPRYGI